jgi:EAL domain-containing protein (putative c-di-GMP-specific phosphodiesterase class I)
MWRRRKSSTGSPFLREKCHELGKDGVSLGIDNFGRGNSSFSLFRFLPFSEIKIDPSHVQGCASNAGNTNVCKSMIQVAHNFARKAVAVGIETGEDAQELVKLGCDAVQGYIFGKQMMDRQLMPMVMAGHAQSNEFIGRVSTRKLKLCPVAVTRSKSWQAHFRARERVNSRSQSASGWRGRIWKPEVGSGRAATSHR